MHNVTRKEEERERLELQRLEALDDAGRLCHGCIGEFEPAQLTTIDDDPGDPEVGPQPDITTLCDECMAAREEQCQ